MDMFRKLSARRAYRRLFLDEHGQLKPEALTVLEDLYDHARLFKNVPLDYLPVAEGGREVVRHILKRINLRDQETTRQIKQGVYDNE